VASTALAAKSLLEEFDGTHKISAAICSAVCVTVYPGLEILSRSIQDGPGESALFEKCLICIPVSDEMHLYT
jgi:prephenate dehydratase